MKDIADIKKIETMIFTLIAYFKKDEINFARLDLPKVFYETVKKEYLEEGYKIIKSVFPAATPKMLDTNYAFFWFYCLNISCFLEEKYKEKFLQDLSILYTYIHINSIIRKHVRYNFDYNIWWEAVQRSRSRYLKKGGINLLVDTISLNTAQRLIQGPYKNYCTDKKLFVKSYYMMRHKISQILKPVLEIYYALIEIKRKHTPVGDKLSGADITETSTVREFILWFDELIEQEQILSKIEPKSCLKKIMPVFIEMKNISLPEKEYIIKHALRKVVDENFWKNEPFIVNSYTEYSANISFSKFIECLIALINSLYNTYVSRLHNKSLDELILLYFLREI